jgi:HK97 gp10 family phage protein
MAKATVKMPDDLLLQLSKLGKRTDEIIPKVLEAGGEILLDRIRSNLKSVIGKNTKIENRSSGELVRSLGLSPAKLSNKGEWNIKVGFREPRNGGGSNARIANILEYGKHGQPPKPFLKPAKKQEEKRIIAAMKAKLEQEIAK